MLGISFLKIFTLYSNSTFVPTLIEVCNKFLFSAILSITDFSVVKATFLLSFKSRKGSADVLRTPALSEA